LCLLATTDHCSNRLENKYTIAFLLLGVVLNLLAVFAACFDAIVGAVVGYVAIRLLHDSQIVIRGNAGIGMGDAKLLAGLGAWFGWQSLPLLVVAGSIVTLIVYPKRKEKPFGVGLISAAAAIAATVGFKTYSTTL